MARMSIACIDKPEFINLTPCNPLISQCEIKVMYVGENRNRSYISKEVATEMANSLPGCPIVGYFKEDKQDFADHGDRVVIDDTGLHFKCMTRPYGFVAPDAKVWFQKFEDTDDFGNTVIREYLMTTGYLWTGQYPECKSAAEGQKPHSMELDDDTLDGNWASNNKTGVEFFIINDALFSKLCILGDDVEPCFEGSTVSKPDISTSFTKVDDKFTQTLFSMMQDLKFALKGEENNMDKFDKDLTLENQEITDTSETSFAKKDEEDKENKAPNSEESKESKSNEEGEPESKEEDEDKKKKFAKAKAEDEEDEEKKKFKKEEEDKEDKSSEDKNEKNEDEEEKKKFALLQEEHNALLEKFSALEAQNQELLAFKENIENEKKDTLIQSFYMLSDEDKKDVVENKSKYTLDEIEAKLSVICVRNKVNFDLDDTSKNEEKVESNPITTFNLEEQASSVPAWVTALKNTRDSRNI